MGNLREIKRGHPIYEVCPICGHTKWCFTTQDKKGNLYVMCNRDTLKCDQNGFTYLEDTITGISKYVFGTRELVFNPNWKPTPPAPSKKVSHDAARFSDSKLDKMYRKMLSMLILEDRHREYLHKEGFTDEMIERYNIKSFPPADGKRLKENIVTKNPKRYEIGQKLYEEFGDLAGLPGAYLAKSKNKDTYYWTFAGKEGIVFPITNIYGEIVMLQIRLDNPGPKEGKYKALSSANSDINEIWYLKGCSPSNRVGVIKPKILGDTYAVYLTEGIKKAIITAEKLGCITITVQGVNSWQELIEKNDRGEVLIFLLKEKYGTGLIIVAYDADKSTNEHVLKAQTKVVETLKNIGLMTGLAEWEIWMGKGIDDMIRNGYMPRYSFAD